jgi:hypothetical protein
MMWHHMILGETILNNKTIVLVKKYVLLEIVHGRRVLGEEESFYNTPSFTLILLSRLKV